MPERLYQYRLDGGLDDVTPRGFKGLEWPEAVKREIERSEQLGRFVREIRDHPPIVSPADAATYFMAEVFTPFEQFDQEELYVLLLNTKNRPTHEVMVYRGTINTVYVRGAEVYKEAVRVNAPAIIVSHCHPSGDPTPSADDIKATESMYEVGKLLDIDLLDHIILGKDTWVSMKERNLGFR